MLPQLLNWSVSLQPRVRRIKHPPKLSLVCCNPSFSAQTALLKDFGCGLYLASIEAELLKGSGSVFRQGTDSLPEELIVVCQISSALSHKALKVGDLHL